MGSEGMVVCEERGECRLGEQCGGATPHMLCSECGHCPHDARARCVETSGVRRSEATWEDRYREWKALYDYARENWVELEEKGRMRAITLCMQRTWGEMRRLRKGGANAEDRAVAGR